MPPFDPWGPLEEALGAAGLSQPSPGVPGDYFLGRPYNQGLSRQVTLLRGGQGNETWSGQVSIDPTTGLYQFGGRGLYPTEMGQEPFAKTPWGARGAAQFMGRIAAGANPAAEFARADEFAPFRFGRQPLAGGVMSGGQVLPAWTVQEATSRFLPTVGSNNYTDFAMQMAQARGVLSGGGAEAGEELSLLASGFNRRAWAAGYGGLASSMNSLYTSLPGYYPVVETYPSSGASFVMGYNMPGGVGKLRTRQDIMSPERVPYITGAPTTSPRLTGYMPGAERRVGLEMMQEYVPGLHIPFGGQSYVAAAAMRGVETSTYRQEVYERPWSYIQETLQAGAPAAMETAGVRGQRIQPGTPFGQLSGMLLGYEPPGYRGVSGATYAGSQLMLPYGRQFGTMVATIDPSFLSGAGTYGTTGVGPSILQREPRTWQEKQAYQHYAEQFLGRPGVQQRLGGGNVPAVGYFPTGFEGGKTEPYLQASFREFQPWQSGTLMYTEGLKSVGLAMRNLTQMGADPRAQMLVGEEAVKGQQYLVGGLAYTLPQSTWERYLGRAMPGLSQGEIQERYFPYGQGGPLRWADQGVWRATQMMMDPANRTVFQRELEAAGGYIRQGWYTPVQGQDTEATLRQFGMLEPEKQWRPGMQPQIGMWRPGPAPGSIQQYLEGIGFRTAITPADVFRGGPTSMSLNDLLQISKYNPEFLGPMAGGDLSRRTGYMQIMQAAGGLLSSSQQTEARGLPANLLSLAEEMAKGAGWTGTQVPGRYVIEALGRSQGAGVFTKMPGGMYLPPASSLMAEGMWTASGDPRGALGSRILEAINASLATTGINMPGGASGVVEMTAAREAMTEFAQSPQVMKTAFGSDPLASLSGRAVALGGLWGTGMQNAAVPGMSFLRGLPRSSDLFMHIARAPRDVTPEQAMMMMAIMSPGQFNVQARRVGMPEVAPEFLRHGVLGLAGESLSQAEILKEDADRDLNLGYVGIMSNWQKKAASSLRDMAARVRQFTGWGGPGSGREKLSKAFDASATFGMGLWGAVQRQGEALREATPEQLRTMGMTSALSKSRIGIASNLMNELGLYMEQRIEGLTGEQGARYRSSSELATRLMGAVKQGFIDEVGAVLAEGLGQEGLDYGAPIMAGAFAGQGHRPGSLSVPAEGRFPAGDDLILPRRKRVYPGDIMYKFTQALGRFGRGIGWEQPMIEEAIAGTLGGWRGAGGAIEGLPGSVPSMIAAAAAGRPASMAGLLPTPEDITAVLEESPLMAMAMGRAFYGAGTMGESELEGAPAYQRERIRAIRQAMPLLPRAQALARRYEGVHSVVGVGSNVGALAGTAGVRDFSLLMRALQRMSSGGPGIVRAAMAAQGFTTILGPALGGLEEEAALGAMGLERMARTSPPEEDQPFATDSLRIARFYRNVKTAQATRRGEAGHAEMLYADLSPEELESYYWPGEKRLTGPSGEFAGKQYRPPAGRFQQFKAGLGAPAAGFTRVYHGGFRQEEDPYAPLRPSFEGRGHQPPPDMPSTIGQVMSGARAVGPISAGAKDIINDVLQAAFRGEPLLGSKNTALMEQGMLGTEAVRRMDRPAQTIQDVIQQSGRGKIIATPGQLSILKGQLDFMQQQQGMGGAETSIRNLIDSSTMVGKVPTLPGENERQSYVDFASSLGSLSKPVKELKENLDKLNASTGKYEEAVGKAQKSLAASLKEERMISERTGLTPQERQAYLTAQSMITKGRRESLEQAEAELGLAQQGALGGDAGGGRTGFGAAFANLGARFTGEKKFMTFFDLMYMQRLGSMFVQPGMQAAAAVGAADQAVAGGMFGAGIGGAWQSGQTALAGLQAQAQWGLGRSFSQVWTPAQQGMTQVQKALGPVQAIMGPALAAGLVGEWMGGTTMMGGALGAAGITAGTFLGAAGAVGMAGLGLTSAAIQSQTPTGIAATQQQLASMYMRGGGSDAEWIGAQFQMGVGTLGAGLGQMGSIMAEMRGRPMQSTAAAGPMARNRAFGEGPGFWDIAGQRYAGALGGGAGAMIRTLQGGVTAQAMRALTPAQQLGVTQTRADQMVSWMAEAGMVMDPAAAQAAAASATMLAPGGLSNQQLQQIATATTMGVDVAGLSQQVFAAGGGVLNLGRSDLAGLMGQISAPGGQAAAARYMASGWDQISQISQRYGGPALDLGTMPKEEWALPQYQQLGTGIEMLNRLNLIRGGGAAGARAITQANVLGPGGPVQWSEQQIRQLQLAVGQAESFTQGGMGYMATALTTEQLSQWTTGNQLQRSDIAMEAGMPWLATNITQGPFRGAANLSYAPMFGGIDVSGAVQGQGSWAQGFRGQAGVTDAFGRSIGGMIGAQRAYRREQLGFQGAGLGIAMQQLALQREYVPQMWAVEDQMTALGREQQMYSWQVGSRQMAMQERQFSEGWERQVGQFRVAAGWQREDFATRATAMGQTRQWAREDWATNAQTRAMQWGWQQEDFQENVRFMSGRERRVAVRGMERATTMKNIEDEQIEKQKSRQEEIWKREEEEFKKTQARFEEQTKWREEGFEKEKQYFEERMGLQEEAHKKELEFMQRRWELEDQLRALQREYQEKQWDLQEKQLALQGAQLAAERERMENEERIEDVIAEIYRVGLLANESAGGAAAAWQRIMDLLGGVQRTQPLCFVAGTMITMANGTEKPIEQIKVGDSVLSLDGDSLVPSEVVSVMPPRSVNETLKIYRYDGTEIEVTGEHPFLTNDGWKKAKDLVAGETIFAWDGEDLYGEPIEAICDVIGAPVTVYNFEVDRVHNYIAGGVVVHNKSQTGFSGMVYNPATVPGLGTVAEGTGGMGGAPEWVEVKPLGAGGIPEALGQRGGVNGNTTVHVYIDGKEVASRITIEHGNRLKVEARR